MAVRVDLRGVFEGVRARIEPLGVFGPVEVKGDMLIAPARAAAEPAFYRLEPGAPGQEAPLWVSLVTPSRWLSESIESDLVEHGDDLGELVEDELIELGYEGAGLPPTFQHFRSPDLLYTFRTPIPVDPASITRGGSAAEHALDVAATWLRAYEQAFRRLGDMEDDAE